MTLNFLKKQTIRLTLALIGTITLSPITAHAEELTDSGQEYLEQIVINNQKNLSENIAIINVEELAQCESMENIKYKISDILYEKQITDLLKEYAHYFDLDEENVVALAKEITNNYTSEEFLDTYNIGNTTIGKTSYTYDTVEAGIMTFVYNLYKSPENFGYSKEDFRLNNAKKTLQYESNVAVLENGYTVDQFMGKVCDGINLDASLAASVSSSETGHYSSRMCREDNNYGGIGGVGHFVTLPTPEAGVIYYAMNLKRIINAYYDENNINVSALSGIYVNGKKGSVAPEWVANVNRFYGYYEENKEEYFDESMDDVVKLCK